MRGTSENITEIPYSMRVGRFKFALILCITLCTPGASQAQNQAKPRIETPMSLACSLDIPSLLHLSWNQCSTENQCRADWDKHRIAHIKDMTTIYVDHPERYKLDINGTLTIKEVIPYDDNTILICRGRTPFGIVEDITVLEIIREQPQINTRNPIYHEIIEGMPLMLEFKVHGYPYPLVTLYHNQDIVKKGMNIDPMFIRQNATKLHNGNYTCTAENLLGNASITIKVKVLANPNSDKNSSRKVLATVFIVLFCVVAIALSVVSYMACCKRPQSIPQVDDAQGRAENGFANGSTVRFVNSQAFNGSPRIDRANGSEGNRVTNGNVHF